MVLRIYFAWKSQRPCGNRGTAPADSNDCNDVCILNCFKNFAKNIISSIFFFKWNIATFCAAFRLVPEKNASTNHLKFFKPHHHHWNPSLWVLRNKDMERMDIGKPLDSGWVPRISMNLVRKIGTTRQAVLFWSKIVRSSICLTKNAQVDIVDT